MFNFLKKSKFFDRTLAALLMAVFLIVVIIISTYPKTKPANEKAVALKSADLINGQDAIEKIIKGDSVIILGQRLSAANLEFWIETKSGQRGFVSQDVFDNRAIVYKTKKVDDNENLNIQHNDTVVLIGISAKQGSSKRWEIKTKDGKTGTVKSEGLMTIKGSELAKYTLNDRRACYISKSKFEKLYIGKTFEEVDNLYCKAIEVTNKKGQKEAVYELRVFDKKSGGFYSPTILFEDNIAKSYSLEKATNFKNKWFLKNNYILKYLPLADKILDIGFFANIIKGNMFESPVLSDFSDTAFKKVLAVVMAIFVALGGLLWIFTTNLLIPLLLFGLLKFRYPLIFLSNKKFQIVFITVAIITSYIWLVLGLSYSFFWWFFIPIVIYLLLYTYRQIKEFFYEFPDNRCPECKRLYSIEYQEKNLDSEHQEWRPVTERGNLLDSHTEKWQTWDDVTTTTTHSDGSKSSSKRKENIQNHSRTINVYQYNEYNVLYMVRKYKHTYKCSGCGHKAYSYSEKLEELNRKYVKSYAK